MPPPAPIEDTERAGSLWPEPMPPAMAQLRPVTAEDIEYADEEVVSAVEEYQARERGEGVSEPLYLAYCIKDVLDWDKRANKDLSVFNLHADIEHGGLLLRDTESHKKAKTKLRLSEENRAVLASIYAQLLCPTSRRVLNEVYRGGGSIIKALVRGNPYIFKYVNPESGEARTVCNRYGPDVKRVTASACIAVASMVIVALL